MITEITAMKDYKILNTLPQHNPNTIEFSLDHIKNDLHF